MSKSTVPCLSKCRHRASTYWDWGCTSAFPLLSRSFSEFWGGWILFTTPAALNETLSPPYPSIWRTKWTLFINPFHYPSSTQWNIIPTLSINLAHQMDSVHQSLNPNISKWLNNLTGTQIVSKHLGKYFWLIRGSTNLLQHKQISRHVVCWMEHVCHMRLRP